MRRVGIGTSFILSLSAVLAACEQQRFEVTADRRDTVRHLVANALDPEAVPLISLASIRQPPELKATAIELAEGSTLVVVTGTSFEEDARPEDATLVVRIDEGGQMVPISVEAGAFEAAAGSWKAPPFQAAMGASALVVYCTPEQRAFVYDADVETFAEVSMPQAKLCVSGGERLQVTLGRALEPKRALTLDTESKIVAYDYRQGAFETVEVYRPASPEEGTPEWVEEKSPGVYAWVRWTWDPELTRGWWEYGQSDREERLQQNYDALPMGSRPNDQAPGVPRIRLEASGSLLVHVEGRGLYRWHVQAGNEVELVAEDPKAPYSVWLPPFGFGSSLAQQVQQNPNATNLMTPVEYAVRYIDDDAFRTARVRLSPCASDDDCALLGETFTLAVVGPPSHRIAVQALWAWETIEIPTPSGKSRAVDSRNVGAIVAVPANERP